MKKIIKYLDKPLLIASILLFAIGLIMVFSSSSVIAYMSHTVSPAHYFVRQCIYLFVGTVGAIIMICIKESTYSKISRFAMYLFLILLALLPVLGVERNSAKSWYDLGIFMFQPSEFFKVITILYLASYYERHKDKNDKVGKMLYPIGLSILGCIMIAFFQPDLGTAVIYALIVASIFVIAPIEKKLKTKTIVGFAGGAILGAILLFATNNSLLLDRQAERIDEFRRPCDRLLSSGNQVCNAYIAINNGGLFGVGLGNSTQKYLYLPEPYTDFIFAIVAEELGLIACLGIILLFIFVIIRILQIGRKSYTDRGAMMCFGIATFIVIHIGVNLLGIFGVIPMTGVPLPFMSFGGSFTLSLIGALSLAQRISIENGLNYEKELKQKK